MRIVNTVTIDRPVDRVFAYVTTIENVPRYSSVARVAEQTSAGPLGVGTTLRIVGRFLGKDMETTYRVTEYETDKVLAYVSTSGPVPQRWRFTFEPVGGGTCYTAIVEAEPGGLFRLGAPMLAGTIKRQGDADMSALKELLERGPDSGRS